MTAARRSSGPTPARAAGPVYQPITLGTGLGDQPPPEYPREAQRAGEQGTVIVQIDVDADGRVTAATAVTRCEWPILDAAATCGIRENWTFPAGAIRHYQVSITYKLKDDPMITNATAFILWLL